MPKGWTPLNGIEERLAEGFLILLIFCFLWKLHFLANSLIHSKKLFVKCLGQFGNWNWRKPMSQHLEPRRGWDTWRSLDTQHGVQLKSMGWGTVLREPQHLLSDPGAVEELLYKLAGYGPCILTPIRLTSSQLAMTISSKPEGTKLTCLYIQLFSLEFNRQILSHLEPACFAYPMTLHPECASYR